MTTDAELVEHSLRDKALCAMFPKLYKQRHASMQETCMCWGFEVGLGWMGIIEALSANIQHHINQQRGQRAKALKYRRAYARAQKGDMGGIEHWYADEDGIVHEHARKAIARDLEVSHFYITDDLPRKVKQVVVTQVKEKFGTLRFYYNGGDEAIAGMVTMAEAMTAITCEECGSPGKLNRGGWLSVRCDKHRRK